VFPLSPGNEAEGEDQKETEILRLEVIEEIGNPVVAAKQPGKRTQRGEDGEAQDSSGRYKMEVRAGDGGM
jgi:hypothetical protein